MEVGQVTFKQAVILLSLSFVIVLAVVVARQMSTEAMAVVIGIVCGVLSGIPTSVLVLVAMNRRDSKAEVVRRQAAQSAYPPVVVVQGGAPQAFPPMLQGGYWPSPMPSPSAERHFHVVGGDELLVERGDFWQS